VVAELGALYNRKHTGEGSEGGSVGDWHLVVLVADGDSLVNHGGHEGFLMLILGLLKGSICVVG
jgi:hypothetical protein